MAMRTVQSQAGVMLIEALIGILIFSIGILALLGMQGTAIKNTTDARYRSEAAYLASQVIGQMWVNDKEMLSNWDTRPAKGPALFPPRDDWKKKVASFMPGAIAPEIAVGPDPAEGLGDREVRVRVQWLHPGADNGEAPRQVLIVNRIYGAVSL
jgi:type IV pilus assembly protein PilV